MKVFFDEKFLQTYTGDPAASPGRLDHAFSLGDALVAFLQ
jgi:hypothetical protein